VPADAANTDDVVALSAGEDASWRSTRPRRRRGMRGRMPRLRSDHHPSYFAALIEDPDGNRIEAVCHRT
jgi:hypothetical protein